MRIRIGDRGEMRHVRIASVTRTKDDTVSVTGLIGFGRAERVSIEIDADTLAEMVRAALQSAPRPELSGEPDRD